jgi:hypothetical protein
MSYSRWQKELTEMLTVDNIFGVIRETVASKSDVELNALIEQKSRVVDIV